MEISLLVVVYIIYRLCRESYQEHKANQYADKVVRKYKDDGTPK